uniref:hypothetical protein n=1 Tax=Ascoseira mirabilis TaxID=76830 RepID=UPI0030022FB4|nr:hypothetical protein ASMI152 [Ascoseira mirabilis]
MVDLIGFTNVTLSFFEVVEPDSIDYSHLVDSESLDFSKYSTPDYYNLIIDFMIMALQQFYWTLTLRFSVQWFPNINPYIFPAYMLLEATDFYLEEFKNLVPSLLGMDMSGMLAFLCLEYMIRTLEAIKFY